MITAAHIESATAATRTLSESQAQELAPLVDLLSNWVPMHFAETVDVNYRRAARDTCRTLIAERLAEALLAGRLPEAIKVEVQRIDPRDLAGFHRTVKYHEISLTA